MLQGLDRTPCNRSWVSCLTVHQAEVRLVDQRNPYGGIEDGRLVVSGETRSLDALNPRERHCMCYTDSAKDDDANWWFDANEREATCSGKLISLLLGGIVMDPWKTYSVMHFYALILQEVVPGSDVFRRIGVSKERSYRNAVLYEPLTRYGEYREITLV